MILSSLSCLRFFLVYFSYFYTPNAFLVFRIVCTCGSVWERKRRIAIHGGCMAGMVSHVVLEVWENMNWVMPLLMLGLV